MPLPLVVPDASVLLKWVLPSDDEPDTDRALSLRTAIVEESVRALLPSLWLYEVGNTIARRFPAYALSWMSALIKFELQEAPPTQAWLTTALELTKNNREKAAKMLGIGERTLYRNIEEWQLQDQIKNAVDDAGGDLEKAAKQLDMTKDALDKRLKKLGQRVEDE